MAERLTHVWPVDPDNPDLAIIAKAAAILRSGGLVAFPTETVYGLGANALDPAAVAGIYEAKGRPSNNPLIVHVADVDEASPLIRKWTTTAQLLAERFWPGPLTLVLPRSEGVPDIVTGGGPTVAIRCPAHPVARALIAAAGVPIAAPSANRSSELSPTLAAHVVRGLNGRIDAILDGGSTRAGIESTVVDLSGALLRLLRPGPIPASQIEALVGSLTLGHSLEPEEPLPSPGMLARHYAPRTSLELVGDVRKSMAKYVEYTAIGKKVALLAFGVNAGDSEFGIIIDMPVDPVRYGADVYRLLHELDERGLDRIVIQLPPETDEWLAVRDRLLRAAASA